MQTNFKKNAIRKAHINCAEFGIPAIVYLNGRIAEEPLKIANLLPESFGDVYNNTIKFPTNYEYIYKIKNSVQNDF